MRDLSRKGIMSLNQTDFECFRATLDMCQEVEREQVCDFIEEREGLFDSLEHDILDSIQTGTYTLAIEQMRDTEGRYIFPLHLINWIDENDEGQFEWYDLATHDSLCQMFWKDHYSNATYKEEV